jgi:hypothetical protein
MPLDVCTKNVLKIKNTKISFLHIKPTETDSVESLHLTHDNMDSKTIAKRNISVSSDVRKLACILLGSARSYMSANV